MTPDKTGAFSFTHVPPIFQASIGRVFAQNEGVSIGVPGATVSLLPGETRSLGLGPLSKQQREFLEVRIRASEERIKGALEAKTEETPMATQPR